MTPRRDFPDAAGAGERQWARSGESARRTFALASPPIGRESVAPGENPAFVRATKGRRLS
jgi:hypothetical protein